MTYRRLVWSGQLPHHFPRHVLTWHDTWHPLPPAPSNTPSPPRSPDPWRSSPLSSGGRVETRCPWSKTRPGRGECPRGDGRSAAAVQVIRRLGVGWRVKCWGKGWGSGVWVQIETTWSSYADSRVSYDKTKRNEKTWLIVHHANIHLHIYTFAPKTYDDEGWLCAARWQNTLYVLSVSIVYISQWISLDKKDDEIKRKHGAPPYLT